MTLAWEAMQGQVFRTAGSSAAKKGQRMERILRDMSMGWGHFTIVVTDWAARELATRASRPRRRGAETGPGADIETEAQR